MRMLPWLVSSLFVLAVFYCSAWADTPILPKTSISMPASNMGNSGDRVTSDTQLIYQLSDPLIGPPDNPITGRHFTNFHAVDYLVQLQLTKGRLIASRPKKLFRGPKGKMIGLGALLGGWLIYEQYESYNLASNWQIIARSITTGKAIVLDSRNREGVPSLTPIPHGDGRLVAWQSWTQHHGQPTSVIRTYNLLTGQRRLILEGGSPTTWAYIGVRISGPRLVIEKDFYRTQHAQVLLANLTTGRVRALTPATGAASEPNIGGEIATWKVGWRFSNGSGIVVANLRTGMRTLIHAYNAEIPQVVANRYVVFPAGSNTHIELYDTYTHITSTLVPFKDKAGYGVGDDIRVGGHVVSYTQGKQCGSPTFTCPGRLVLAWLP
jgi:hypothetical protein